MDNYSDLPVFEDVIDTSNGYRYVRCNPQQVMLCEDTEKAAEKYKEDHANEIGFGIRAEYPNGCRYYDEVNNVGYAYFGHVYIFRKLHGDGYVNIVLCNQYKAITPTPMVIPTKDIKKVSL
jgi:hypothetical protein